MPISFTDMFVTALLKESVLVILRIENVAIMKSNGRGRSRYRSPPDLEIEFAMSTGRGLCLTFNDALIGFN